MSDSRSRRFGVVFESESPPSGEDPVIWIGSGLVSGKVAGVRCLGVLTELIELDDSFLLLTHLLSASDRRRKIPRLKSVLELKRVMESPLSMCQPDYVRVVIPRGVKVPGVDLHGFIRGDLIALEEDLDRLERVPATPAGCVSSMAPPVRAGVALCIATFQSALARGFWSGRWDKSVVGDLTASILGLARMASKLAPAAAAGELTSSVIDVKRLENFVQPDVARAVMEIIARLKGAESAGDLRGLVDQLISSLKREVLGTLLGRIVRVEYLTGLESLESSLRSISEGIREFIPSGDIHAVVEFSEQMNLLDLYILWRACGDRLKRATIVLTPLSLLTSLPHIALPPDLFSGVGGRVIPRRPELLIRGMETRIILSSGSDLQVHKAVLQKTFQESGGLTPVYWPNGSTGQVAVGTIVAKSLGSVEIIPPLVQLRRRFA